jgi:hypothetical protein
MKDEIKYLEKHCVIRSRTNWGDLCKQKFIVLKRADGILDPCVIIEKRVLTNRVEPHERHGYKMLKEYKGLMLYEQRFSIKINTLEQAWLKLSS